MDGRRSLAAGPFSLPPCERREAGGVSASDSELPEWQMMLSLGSDAAGSKNILLVPSLVRFIAEEYFILQGK